MAIQDYLVTDDLTILLGLIAATLFLLQNLYKPQPLVHPILLGRQSDVSRVRNSGESAVYRNYATGMMGRFSTKPAKDIYTLMDLVRTEIDAPRTLWSTKITNAKLKERVSAFGKGLIRYAGLVPKESNVLLLLNDSLDFIITDLALASISITSFTLSSPSLLSPVLDSYPLSAIIVDAKFLPYVLESIYDSEEGVQHTVICVGEPSSKLVESAADRVRILHWVDVESEGAHFNAGASEASSPSDVFTISFSQSEEGQLQATRFTHENLTAGVSAIRALFPSANAISTLDTIVSTHSLSTPFGRAIAYTAVYEGTSFATTNAAKIFKVDEPKTTPDITDIRSLSTLPIPHPTVLFAYPSQVQSLASEILKNAQKSMFLYPFAFRHKAAGIAEGFTTKESLWDRLVFDPARSRVLGEGASNLRAIVISGASLELSALTPIRVALSVPFVNAHSHPRVVGPVFASHPLDLQTFPPGGDAFGDLAAVGPTSINVEAKLVGVQDDAVERGGDPLGVLLIRGPPVGRPVAIGEEAEPSPSDEGEDWVGTGERAHVLSNGTFKILLSRK